MGGGDAGASMARVHYSLYDRMLSYERLRKGFLRVKSARGAAGVDGQSIEDFSEELEQNLAILVKELREKTYRPLPVKRVEIPKAGGGKRPSGDFQGGDVHTQIRVRLGGRHGYIQVL
jgi:retron-type reverse transcriptase